MNGGLRVRGGAQPSDNVWSKERAEALLSEGYWFGELPPELRRTIIDRSEIRTFRRNNPLYRIGDAVDGMYAALEGDLRAYLYGDEKQRILLRLIGPTGWFGDFHLIDNYPTRTFEIRAHSDCATLFLGKKDFHEIADASLENYKHFIKLACIQQRFLVRLAVEARSDAQRKAARALIRVAKMHGRDTGAGIELTINLTQSDLASLIGVSRQYVNELIAGWNEDGFVHWRGNSVAVVFINELKTLLSPLDQWMLESEGWV
ncbi:MAG TPA: Crp/Fnr family transcriptional regulator [Rhizomicrobium sp.]|jgi:CRP/FNR family transcriptional regulator|nr:Crp/Fnr family transcriptional regulator [Rhizomicrobium sp.]